MTRNKKTSSPTADIDQPKTVGLVRTRRATPALAIPLKSDISFNDSEKLVILPAGYQGPPRPDIDENSPYAAPSKQDAIIFLLRRKGGATLEEMTAITGWQTHSVRGLISGTLKKKLGLTVTSEPDPVRARIYRIPPEAKAGEA